MNMKRINLKSAILLISIALASCSDVKELDAGYTDKFTNNGAPVIEAIYDISDTEFANPLTEASLNQYIHIKGKNLANAKSININGLEVDLADRAYTESNDSYIRIPRAVPETKTDVITYTTDQGTTTYAFNVAIPSLEFYGLVNEFVAQGSRAQLAGDYFDLYDFGDTLETSPVSIAINNEALNYHETLHTDSCTENFTSIIIPKDCPDNSEIVFSWREDGETKTKTVYYRPTNSLLYGNFDGDLGWWTDWGKTLVANSTASGAPIGFGYNYLRIVGTFTLWSWNSTGFGANWPEGITADNVADYVLKFEVNTNASYPFYNYAGNIGGYSLTLNNANKRYQFDPVSKFGITNTGGEWRTVSIPLLDVLSDSQLPSAGSWVAMELVMQPNTGDGWTVDHSFGQFRIVKSK